MRGTEYLFLVIMIGVFGYLVISGAGQLNKVYPDNPINTSGLGGYDASQSIIDKANQSFNKFQVLGDTEKAWYQKIGAGIVAIPFAIIEFPIMIAIAVISLNNMAVNALGGWVPAPVILAIFAFLIIEAVRRFLEFFQRARA